MFEILNSIIGILFLPIVFLTPICVLIGAIFLISSFFKGDELMKKKNRKLGLKLILIPFAASFALLTLYGILNVIKTV